MFAATAAAVASSHLASAAETLDRAAAAMACAVPTRSHRRDAAAVVATMAANTHRMSAESVLPVTAAKHLHRPTAMTWAMMVHAKTWTMA